MLNRAIRFMIAGGVLAFAAPAMAEETRCTGSIGAVQLDNLLVPEGAACTLRDTRLNGSIVVARNATLRTSNARVNGNVQAEGARLVSLGAGTAVGGSVQLKQGGAVTLSRITTIGDVQLDANRGRISASGNRVGANAQIVGNIGGVVLTNNQIASVLECKENSPAPTGSGNIAGDKKDQCEAL